MAEQVCPVRQNGGTPCAALEGGRENGTGRNHGVRRSAWLAVCCTALGLLFLGLYAGWEFYVDQHPSPILPPAGATLEGPSSFTFAVMGDTRGNMSAFEEALKGARKHDAKLILHTGDIVQRLTPRQHSWLVHELNEAQIDVPFCVVPGNHDVLTEDDDRNPYALYRGAFGSGRYWFGYADTLFVGFDSSSEKARQEDLEWLEDVLQEHRSEFETCIFFTHVPPKDPRPHEDRQIGGDRSRLVAILQEYDITAVFAGHHHRPARGTVGGIPIYIHGGAGEELESPAEVHNFFVCTVTPGGEVVVRRQRVGRVKNEDYLEYAFWAKLPVGVLKFAGMFLLTAGVFLTWRDFFAS